MAKVLIGELRKSRNPHEDVVRWLQDIDEIFNRAKLQAPNKFLVAQAYLTDSADKWFRHNKSKILDWSTFNTELIKTYKPTIDQILFNMEQRRQQTRETVMEYYHDKIYLCSQADPDMNSSMKVHYLLKGLHDLLLPHVIRRHPTTAEEFLTIAQDEEKILSTLNGLSSISINPLDPYPDPPNPYPYLPENLHPPNNINVVQRPALTNNRTARSQHHQPSPPPLMNIPTGSFRAPSRYPYYPSRPLSAPTTLQCYSCYGFGHIARSCPTRKNM